ncbi:TonB-dependent receptor [Ningiella sp. W23]|uniref:TonB-dependent receptor n=1 Tax=Ningiella sp. W23 TaxID=3023715 RepID=UPI003756663E
MKKLTSFPTAIALCTSVACASAVSPAKAQSQLSGDNENLAQVERIVVTADLFDRSLYELPGSNLVIADALIKAREARHIQDIVSVMPNVNFTSGSSRGKFIQIRGIGERSQFAEPINPSIGLLIDDIDISGLGSLATLFDVQQVELLSGPQSVATGISSLGGVIKLVSNGASGARADGQSGRFFASYGQQNALNLGAAFGSDITDTLSARVSAQVNQEDGFVQNAFLNRDDTNNIDEKSATLFLSKALSDTSSLSLNTYLFDIDNGYDAFSLDNDNVTQSDQPGFDKSDAKAASVKYQSAFENVDVQATLTYLDGEFDYAYDEDWTFPAFHPFSYSSFDRYNRNVTRQSADVRINSNHSETPHRWLFGASYRDADEQLLREYTFNDGDFTSRFEPLSLSLYGQYESQLSDSTHVVVAARIENFEADYTDSDFFQEQLDDTLLAASVSVDHELKTNLGQSMLVYGSISRGYKAGGFNFDQRLSADNRTFAPEYNWNYELGIKGSALENRARYQVTVFYMQREDAQVSDFAIFENVLDDGTIVTSFADAVRNTDTGINQGIEITSSFTLTNDWNLNANIGYLDATFGDYTRLDGSFVPEQDQAQAPDFTLYLSSAVNILDNWQWFVDLDAKDEFRFSDGHEERAPFTVVVNSNLSWQYNEHLVRIWVKNLFDREVFTRGFGGFSNDPRDEYAFVEPYFQFGQQRQLGVSYEYQF